ncbi:MAG: D-alanine--D-alanine ligase [Patescibacteria group bacterium]
MLIRKKIAVLRGGPSSEYEISLRTGASVLEHLSSDKYELFDVAIAKDGDWYLRGFKKEPSEILSGVDLVFNALHGEFGEDGGIQQTLDNLRIPYTGSKRIPSALAMNKILAKQEFLRNGLKTPISMVLQKDNYDVREIFNSFPMPTIVKPLNLGSSVGVSLVQTGAELKEALDKIFEYADRVLVEEYIGGKEVTCGVIDNFRNENVYALMPVEIRPKNKFFDYESKYSDATQRICPAGLNQNEKEAIQNIAKKVHQALGLSHYSRTDFIVSPRRGIYVLEVNSLPGLTENSLFPLSLKAVGSDLPEFLEHLIEISLI